MDPRNPSHPSSLYNANFPSAAPLPIGNANGFMPNPIPAYVPQPGNAPAQANNPYGFPLNMVRAAAGAAQNSFQAAYNPPPLINIGHATHVQFFINTYPLQPPAAVPPQRPPVPLQPPGPSEACTAVPPPYSAQGFPQENKPPPVSQNAYQHHGAGPAVGFAAASLPQVNASSASTGQEHLGEDCEEYKPRKAAKRYDISRDMDFLPLKEVDKHGNQLFHCLREKCGTVIIADSYRSHFNSTKHQGSAGEMPLTRHWADSPCTRQRLELETGAQPPSSATSEGSTRSTSSASPAAAPTVPLTFLAPATPASMSIGSTTSNVTDNVQIPPQADEVAQSQGMAVIADPLLPCSCVV
ncbi:uncharacterized protein EDB91DRAFT_1089506 [Suillus paluster]|uniref:uncharacterized protein n=1 Tax=Suillus paluster TaxID=48578 RepID=UPI001B879783|nr:uncharacterized protein EDB91DRAFT_1089506 [Suillus paluster]KAG1719127.1 hypothetical protein EDB91DRAFT_1089506 [Suillus paluster]